MTPDVTSDDDDKDREAVETPLLAAARRGDDAAFGALVRPVERELHVHCYRMLGSLDDADDALQETLVRAWRGLDGYQPHAQFRAWLYRIATNVCLSALRRRAGRGEVALATRSDHGGKDGDPVRLDPYPDRLLDELGSAVPGPEATAERAESVALAFVAAVQLLPPRQRAALLLQDVLGFPAAETAAMLATSVAGTNSALQRARATLERERRAGRITREHAGIDADAESALVRRLIDAWHAADVPAIVATLRADALLTMPPQPERVVGPEAIGAFLGAVPAGGRLDRFRLVPTRANRQPAVALYERPGDAGDFTAHAVMVLAVEGDAIASLVRFADPRLFPRFGLPPTIAAG